MSETHYDRLGVEPGASRDEIREAYRARVAALREARERKGVTDEQLQRNRDEVADLNAAWNVLSDPYQRGRYDQSLAAPAVDDAGVELVASEAPSGRRPRGPRPTGAAARSASRVPVGPATLAPGIELADNRSRGMATLTDFALVLALFMLIQIGLPRLVKSDYKEVTDRIDRIQDQRDAAADRRDRADDRGNRAAERRADRQVDRLEDRIDRINEDELQGVNYAVRGVTFLAGLAILVPGTVRRGQTIGKRMRGVRVVHVDGSRVGFGSAVLRYTVPLGLAMGVPGFGPMLAVVSVAVGLFGRSGQGLHDRLAKTVVVPA